MILADTSIWVDHLRRNDTRLKTLLTANRIITHPFVIGELALGHLRQRDVVLRALRDLPQAISASDEEAFDFIEQHALYGLGIGYVDVHLLASARLTSARLWTRDKRLNEVAIKLRLADS